jgi:hypothetical protein
LVRVLNKKDEEKWLSPIEKRENERGNEEII